MSVGFARESENVIPTFKSLEEWQGVKSTKMDICARICQHMLVRDDAAEIVFQNGKAIFPASPPSLPGQTISQTKKILIYQEFTSLRDLLRNVCVHHPFSNQRTDSFFFCRYLPSTTFLACQSMGRCLSRGELTSSVHLRRGFTLHLGCLFSRALVPLD